MELHRTAAVRIAAAANGGERPSRRRTGDDPVRSVVRDRNELAHRIRIVQRAHHKPGRRFAADHDHRRGHGGRVKSIGVVQGHGRTGKQVIPINLRNARTRAVVQEVTAGLRKTGGINAGQRIDAGNFHDEIGFEAGVQTHLVRSILRARSRRRIAQRAARPDVPGGTGRASDIQTVAAVGIRA